MEIKRLLRNIKYYLAIDKETLFHNALQERLKKSLDQYYKDLNKAFDRLYPYTDNFELRVIRKLSKED